jgi:hypothetical protein
VLSLSPPGPLFSSPDDTGPSTSFSSSSSSVDSLPAPASVVVRGGPWALRSVIKARARCPLLTAASRFFPPSPSAPLRGAPAPPPSDTGASC